MSNQKLTRLVIIFLATFLLLLAGIVAFLFLTPAGGHEEQARTDNTPVAPPPGATAHGYPIGTAHGEKIVAITTDFSCPYCQDLFAENAASLRELAARPELDVHVKIVNIFPESVTNPYAIAAFHEYVTHGHADPLAAYEVLSAASRDTKDLAGDDAVTRFRQEVADARLAGLAVPATLQDATALDAWIRQNSVNNRQDPGVVPAVALDGRTLAWGETKDLIAIEFRR